MKKNRFRSLFILTAIILIIVVIGLVLLKNVNREQESADGIIIKDNVLVITEETEKVKQPVKVTEDELIFSDNPQYSKGDVIVAGILDSAPAGFIRKVVEITKEDGQYIVKTEYGVLTDVFEEAHIKKTFALTEDGAKEIDLNHTEQADVADGLGTVLCINPLSNGISNKENRTAVPMSSKEEETDYLFKKEFEYDIAQGISAKGEVGFNVWLEVEIDIDHGDVIFGVVVHNESDGSIFVGCSTEGEFEFEKELFSKQLPNLQFFIGFVPIVITNELQANIEGEALIEGKIGTSLEIKSENASGFRYTSKTNKVKEIKEKKYLSDGLQWDTEAKFSGGSSAGVFLHIISKLYDSTGADISVGIEGKLEGEVSVKPEKEADELNYVGSVDLSIGPKLKGSIVVTVPVIDEKLAEMPIFEAELEPFWKKHWDSGENWEEELQSLETVELSNTYTTRRREVGMVSCPTFSFDYSDDWSVESEELEIDYEWDVISNERGVNINYYDSVYGFGSQYYGGHYEMQYAEITKVADCSFTPGYPNGCDTDFSSLGNFVVAKIKVYAYEDGASDEGMIEYDGPTYYAVIPESYLGEDMFKGPGYWSICSWEYPSPVVMIAISPDGTFTAEEEKEVIQILSSFREA